MWESKETFFVQKKEVNLHCLRENQSLISSDSQKPKDS